MWGFWWLYFLSRAPSGSATRQALASFATGERCRGEAATPVEVASSTAFRKINRTQAVAGTLVILALIGLASWQAGSLRVGLFVMGGFTGVALALHLAGTALVRAVAPLSRRRWFPLRHAVINVSRPGNQTRVILLAVGLGAFFIITIHALESNLLEQFAIELQDDSPDMFFLDIQPDQEAPIREMAGNLRSSAYQSGTGSSGQGRGSRGATTETE